MTGMKFTEEDKKNFIEFLNVVGKHAEFKMNTTELLNYVKLLSAMQKQILPKIDANILEIKKVVEASAVNTESNQGSEGNSN